MFKPGRIAAAVAALVPLIAHAQGVQGTIKDKNGEVIKHSVVEIESMNLKVYTDENGYFLLPELANGDYALHAVAPGYAHLHQHIEIKDDKPLTINLTLNRSAIEVIDVTATPMHLSSMESAAPVSVLSGETLRRQQAATLGDSLENLPGVQSNFHGNVASTPIIRGLSGPRVLIAQNGLDVSDVSRVGPDHSVASEASTAQQIEVLRGPATLFYGSGAIGGVVNVVDGRVPTDNTTRGEWLLETESVNNQKLGSFNVTSGAGDVAVYADGYWRESDDYDTPVAPDNDESGENADHVVKNSAEESSGFTVGTSYLMKQGYVGIAIERFNREYGIPGHSHGGEDTLESVFADLEQTKVQLLGEYQLDTPWLDTMRLKAGHTQYEHAEIESDAVGTTFENDTDEVRLDLLHAPLNGWRGGLSLHYKHSDVVAQGEEAFTPPSTTKMLALGLMEERHFADVLVQLGARVERVTLDADNVRLPHISAHAHGEDAQEDMHSEHDHSGHDHEEALSVTRVFRVDLEFTPVSLSAGAVWDFAPGYNAGISVSRAQRAPSASELLSFGPHIGTGTYEIGALFALTGDNDHALGLSSQAVDLETSHNIDLTLRKTEGDIGFIFNAFYNQVDNYYYQIDSGLFAESGHDHNHGAENEEESGHDHSSELPVYVFDAKDAILHGFEAQIAWQMTDEFKAEIFSDFVRARLQDGGDLPRTPPLRFGTHLSYQTESITANLDITHYARQDRIAQFETETGGYTLVDAFVSYDIAVLQQDMSVYLKGTNLTDTEARVHSSFLKDLAPRPGRSIGIGLRGYF